MPVSIQSSYNYDSAEVATWGGPEESANFRSRGENRGRLLWGVR
jgi:hypothetical protein